MNYYYDTSNGVYVIELNSINNNEDYQAMLKEISLKEMEHGNNIYYIYYYCYKDINYCIIDFQKRKFSNEDIESIISPENRRSK